MSIIPERTPFIRVGLRLKQIDRAVTLRPNAAPSSPSFSRLAGLAEPLRISRYMLSISVNYLVARSAGHQACGSFNSRMYLFADHQFSFAPGARAAEHQLEHPKCNYAIRFGRQLHQRSELPSSHSITACGPMHSYGRGTASSQFTTAHRWKDDRCTLVPELGTRTMSVASVRLSVI